MQCSTASGRASSRLPAAHAPFIKDLGRLAPETLLTGSTLSFFGGLGGNVYRFKEVAEFDAYVRWAMVWPGVFEGE